MGDTRPTVDASTLEHDMQLLLVIAKAAAHKNGGEFAVSKEFFNEIMKDGTTVCLEQDENYICAKLVKDDPEDQDNFEPGTGLILDEQDQEAGAALPPSAESGVEF